MGPEVERTEFSYDADNNMIAVEANGTNLTFRYNSDNHYEHVGEVREENKPKALGCSRRARSLGIIAANVLLES